MRKIQFLLVCCAFAASSCSRMTVHTVADEGAWCWFADPRAIHYANDNGTINSTFIGYIDVHGNIKATQINHLTNERKEVLIRSDFQPDDHDNPTFLVLPDERIMIFYSKHSNEPVFYYRISQKPGDITALGKEIVLKTEHNTTYPSPFMLSDDPDHIYLCWRGIGWHPTIATLPIPKKENDDVVDFDWGPYQLVRSKQGAGGVRPYAKYVSNGKDKIYLAYTTTHPDNQMNNWAYFSTIDVKTKQLQDVKGRVLETIGSGTLYDIDATKAFYEAYPDVVVDSTTLRDWVWEVSIDTDQHPVIAMTKISADKASHDYYHARWTGNEWRKTFLTNAGGHFHQSPTTERCYSGGMAIDKANPYIIYGSVPVEGKHGSVYELKKFTVNPAGTLASTEQLTFDSPKNNVRPYVIFNKGAKPQLAWMQGDYYYWIVNAKYPQGFPTAIRTNMHLPPAHTGRP